MFSLLVNYLYPPQDDLKFWAFTRVCTLRFCLGIETIGFWDQINIKQRKSIHYSLHCMTSVPTTIHVKVVVDMLH